MMVIRLVLLVLFQTTLLPMDVCYSWESDFNFGWKFYLQPDSKSLHDKIPLNDADWRNVRLPHDWSVEASFDRTLEGCTGYLPGGIGWYQKHFETPVNLEHNRTFILFDGVYNNATFWMNGNKLGENPYGYSPVYFDVTDYLNKTGVENIITVHVDHSRYADSRWYTGSGIYRNVKLIILNKLHIPIWGTYLTTPEITEERATVRLETKVVNTLEQETFFTLSTSIVDANGKIVAVKKDQFDLERDQGRAFVQKLNIAQPKLWSPERPTMYSVISTLVHNNKKVDEKRTPFGIRSLHFDPEKGFFLNGKPYLIKGVCLHHDGGLVGAAVPKGVWRRRLKELKAAGCNAIRLAHNPYSKEFLDLCDELGFLVQNEFFDEWDYAKDKRLNYHDRHDDFITRGYTQHFQKWAKSDLTRTMLRDRNHPSVFQWSIGNEIEWTYLHYRFVSGFWNDPADPQNSGNFWGSPPMFSPTELKNRYDASPKEEYILTETAQKLNNWVKELDQTRPTTANLVIPHVSHASGYADAVDLVGYSYRNIEIGWGNKHYPHKQITINECPGSWDDWKHVLERTGVFSMYMWTGIAYLGESHDSWPIKAWQGDMLNLAGFRNRGWSYFKSIWVDEPHISIGTLPITDSKFAVDKFGGQPIAKDTSAYKWDNSNTHWNYQPGEIVLVDVCSNYTTVELLLNGKSLGSRSMPECPDRLFRWSVPFEAGTLTARAGFDGAIISTKLVTANQPKGFTLDADKTILSADGYDVAHLVVQLVDQQGRPVKTENREVTFDLEGDARILGVDNGARNNVQDFQADHLLTDQGRCLMIIQSNKTKGKIAVTAKVNGMNSQTVHIRLQ